MDMEKNDNVKVAKKPYRNYTWFVLLVVIALAIMIIQTVYSNNRFFNGNLAIVFIVCTLIGGYAGYTIIYELGKLLFGKISKLNFVSINLLFLTIYKANNSFKLKFVFPEGWGGNLHMSYKEDDINKTKPILYLCGGFISVILVAIISCLVAYIIGDKAILYTCLVLSCIGLLVLMANLLPFYTDGISDGFAIRLLLDSENKKTYLDNCNQYAYLNYSLGALKEYQYDNYCDVLQAESLIYRYYFYMDNKQYSKAKECVELMLANKDYLTLESRQIAYNAKLYFMLLNESDEVCYDYYYSLDKVYRNFPISKDSLEGVKVGMLVALKIEKTYDVYGYLLANYHKMEDLYYPTRKDAELELIQKSINIVEQRNPDWKD